MDYIAGFVPGLAESRAKQVLWQALDRHDYRIVESGDRTPDDHRKALVEQAFQKPSRWVQQTRLSWLAANGDTVAMMWDEGGWDLGLLRDLSRVCGGFVAAVKFRSTLAEYGFALFFNGRTVQAWIGGPRGLSFRVGDPVEREQDVLPFFSRCVAALTDNQMSDLFSIKGPEVHALSLMARTERDLEAISVSDEPPLTRAVFALANESAFTTALGRVEAAGIADLRWVARRSLRASLPFVLVEGDGKLDEKFFISLARSLECPALAVELGQDGWFRWLRFDSGERMLGGSAAGAEALIDRWKDIGVILAEPVGFLNWPSDEPGQLVNWSSV